MCDFFFREIIAYSLRMSGDVALLACMVTVVAVDLYQRMKVEQQWASPSLAVNCTPVHYAFFLLRLQIQALLFVCLTDLCVRLWQTQIFCRQRFFCPELRTYSGSRRLFLYFIKYVFWNKSWNESVSEMCVCVCVCFMCCSFLRLTVFDKLSEVWR